LTGDARRQPAHRAGRLAEAAAHRIARQPVFGGRRAVQAIAPLGQLAGGKAAVAREADAGIAENFKLDHGAAARTQRRGAGEKNQQAGEKKGRKTSGHDRKATRQALTKCLSGARRRARCRLKAYPRRLSSSQMAEKEGIYRDERPQDVDGKSMSRMVIWKAKETSP